MARFSASASAARFAKNAPVSCAKVLVTSNPARISFSSKIRSSALSVSLVSRFNAAIASAAVCPVSACCPASSRMTMVPPLMALFVVELASPLAPIAMGTLALRPSKLGSVEPGVALLPPATLPWLSVPIALGVVPP
ncbi:hypothetical protein LMG3412_06486 [Achromobacter deleyi]|nr:hypothetical protein LMG3412_06486 [Achromobacter deleyi]